MAEDDILCFAQDPLYEDADKTVLAETGISVLENPLAFLEVDDTSLVFSLSPETPVRQIVADIALPAIMIWNRVEKVRRKPDWVGHTECEDNISPRVTEMINRHYAELDFPEDTRHFSRHLAIYVRRSDS
ncbi:hypothetical protein QBC33DRAFT_561423 [Phialemonium atrogriseum]|uniref:SRR1-like domain-containing protein n=1 Tax=Phialemonium atrogriseum TaxID=1093897 RepID=A0AAJ0FEU3_9PEZI|nr:uncharacterized protein QBC33DRAFT_561423 [Phialemonium atrogriseum]KAK1764742.1 hypothetical protein QBC33DRAFT_561423 [Phialemonium atrogriseum]